MTQSIDFEQWAELVKNRRSVRAFLPQPVPQSILEAVFDAANWAPSNCNTQPWQVHIASGESAEQLKRGLSNAMQQGEFSMDYPYMGQYEGVQKERQYAAAAALYQAMGIERSDKAARQQAFMNNFDFFGAPHAAFFFIQAGDLREAADLGMYAQTLMLSMAAQGIASCPQTALSFHCDLVREVLNIPAEQKLLFGMSFGYPDPSAAANQINIERASLSENTFFH
ncbi:MAG: nitroreductase [Pseudomonadales bacterium]|nr:nitroreductase [Pseudomonadales bacterium]